MRKSLQLLATIAPLTIAAAVGLPAVAGSAVTPPTDTQPTAGSIDLEAVPVKPVTGPQSVKGVATDDESDATSASGKTSGDEIRDDKEDSGVDEGDD